MDDYSYKLILASMSCRSLVVCIVPFDRYIVGKPIWTRLRNDLIAKLRDVFCLHLQKYIPVWSCVCPWRNQVDFAKFERDDVMVERRISNRYFWI